MTIALGWWLIPTALSAICLGMMFRPDREPCGGLWDFSLTPLFRAFWLIPILLVWLVYFAALAA